MGSLQSTYSTFYSFVAMHYTLLKRNSECDYNVVKPVANGSEGYYHLPQVSLHCSDVHYPFFTVYSVDFVGFYGLVVNNILRVPAEFPCVMSM